MALVLLLVMFLCRSFHKDVLVCKAFPWKAFIRLFPKSLCSYIFFPFKISGSFLGTLAYGLAAEKLGNRHFWWHLIIFRETLTNGIFVGFLMCGVMSCLSPIFAKDCENSGIQISGPYLQNEGCVLRKILPEMVFVKTFSSSWLFQQNFGK